MLIESKERGVFEALEKGYLEALKLSLAIDAKQRSKVFEYYTFSFTYQADGPKEVSSRIESIGIAASRQEHFLVDVAQQSFKLAIRHLLRLLQGLPPLPRKWLFSLCFAWY